MEKILLAWSGGKDSAMALYTLKKAGAYEVAALLTTMTEGYDRISMHGVRRTLLEAQADSLGIPLEKNYISQRSSNEEYEARMKEKLTEYQGRGISAVAFGDIFLEDLKKYREGNLAKIGMRGLFPLWKRPTVELANAFIDLGFEAIITCVDSQALDGSFAGRRFDKKFISDLPSAVDPCGENGEFHSFVCGGPLFRQRIPFDVGEITLREERFFYRDLVQRL